MVTSETSSSAPPMQYTSSWREDQRFSTEGNIISKYCSILKTRGGGAPTPPFVPRWGVWICMYVGWLNYSAACEVTFRPRVVVLALEHKGLIIGLHCTLFKAGINAKPSSIDLIHPFIWSLLRKDRPGRLIYSTDDRCYGNKCNGVCGCLHFSLGVLSQVAAVEENCNDRHYCFKLISHWLNWGF